MMLANEIGVDSREMERVVKKEVDTKEVGRVRWRWCKSVSGRETG